MSSGFRSAGLAQVVEAYEWAFRSHAQRDHCAANSVKARDRAVVRGGAIAEVEHDLVDVTPSPAFGPIHLTEAEIELMGRRNVSVDWVEPMLEAL